MAVTRTIRIATRSSKLALWQAERIKAQLETHSHTCVIVPIESSGDIDLVKPIYEMGVTGVFTKQLDVALLEGRADIAVHSLKDVPTKLAEGLLLAAVDERGAHQDVVLLKNKEVLNHAESKATIASSSLRRKAQWLAKYANHHIVPIRGNVQTRLRKFAEDPAMDGIIFAKAGLERMGLLDERAVILDWMVPAPAQGIIGVVCRNDDKEMMDACAAINHNNSFIAAEVERAFMRQLAGGCSVPISALAVVSNGKLNFTGTVHSYNGKQCYTVKKDYEVAANEGAGVTAAIELMAQPGAAKLVETIRQSIRE